MSEEIFELQRDKELSVVVENAYNPIEIELIHGRASIFGSEMILNKIYMLSSSFSVLTKQGCSLKLSRGFCGTVNPSNSFIFDLHDRLESRRNTAATNQSRGPVVLIVGPTDVGKSTLSKTLLNLAAREGRCPVYVDLDVGQSSVSIPGTICISTVSTPTDINAGFNDSESHVYFFGYKSPHFNIAYYYLLIDKLGQKVCNRMKKLDPVAFSGTVIDTCGWITHHGYNSILVAAKSFEVDTVFVVGDEKLYSSLKHDLPWRISIDYIYKLHGVKTRTQNHRISRRDRLIWEYFHGGVQSLRTFTFNVKFTDIQILFVTRPSQKFQYNELEEARKYITVQEVPITYDLIGSILAVSYANSIEEDIAMSSVLGFVCVKNVDMEENLFTLLSPQPGPLQKKIFLKGDLFLKDLN